jgi:hypothetical protein
MSSEKNMASPQGQTFRLAITGTAYGEWQGTVCGEEGEGQPFRSLLELVKIIDKQVEGD